jgi:signal transduction histidine kinase/HAMP domain-containing protein
MDLAARGDASAAREIVETRIQGQLAPELSSKMTRARLLLDESRNQATRQLGATSRRTMALTTVIACAAGLLVLAGTMLIHRWLIGPVAELHAATQQLTAGRFDQRCGVRGPDELGRLGEALNLLAQRVSEARAGLEVSESKHRSLFRNLRDAVVICDVDGKVLEYHDGDSRLLGVEGHEHIGRPLLEVWPEWRSVTTDWPATLRAAADGKRLQVPTVVLGCDEARRPECVADFLVYRIESGPSRQVAIVARDVSAWHRLQRRVRQAETMEAVGTLAGGLAHDFNNLLTSVTAALNMLAEELQGTGHAERIDMALRACRQAAGLSKRLLNFATSAHGDPQRFRIGEMVEVILGSLDPSFLEGIEIRRELSSPLMVRMDRDQFTQVVLNLIRNAREAMPEGGRLNIMIEAVQARDPEEGTEELAYAVLVVDDSGVGMTPEVRRHIFEPLFTTKSRASGRGRGLGLAIVYSAIKNAGGFVRLTSTPGQGTTFRVHLPVVEGGAVLPAGPTGGAGLIEQAHPDTSGRTNPQDPAQR